MLILISSADLGTDPSSLGKTSILGANISFVLQSAEPEVDDDFGTDPSSSMKNSFISVGTMSIVQQSAEPEFEDDLGTDPSSSMESSSLPDLIRLPTTKNKLYNRVQFFRDELAVVLSKLTERVSSSPCSLQPPMLLAPANMFYQAEQHLGISHRPSIIAG
ncbi:hypothetical protein V6Z12_A07G220000 [Gossypium hirsutum]